MAALRVGLTRSKVLFTASQVHAIDCRAAISRKVSTFGMRGTRIDGIVAAIQKHLVISRAAITLEVGALRIGGTSCHVLNDFNISQILSRRISNAAVKKDTRLCRAMVDNNIKSRQSKNC